MKHISAPALISDFSARLLRSPARVSIMGFAGLIAIGTLLLMLPIATVDHPLNIVDALFMSTSASCVTGLSVMDIGTQLSLFGQLVILVLIQVGGLGILTISTLLLMMMKGRPTLSGQAIIKDTFTYGEGKQTRRVRVAGDLSHRHNHRGHGRNRFVPAHCPPDRLGGRRLPSRVSRRQRLLQCRVFSLCRQLRGIQ